MYGINSQHRCNTIKWFRRSVIPLKGLSEYLVSEIEYNSYIVKTDQNRPTRVRNYNGLVIDDKN